MDDDQIKLKVISDCAAGGYIWVKARKIDERTAAYVDKESGMLVIEKINRLQDGSYAASTDPKSVITALEMEIESIDDIEKMSALELLKRKVQKKLPKIRTVATLLISGWGGALPAIMVIDHILSRHL